MEYIDAEGKPAEAEKFEITAVPTIVLEYGGRTQRATSVDEQAITNALKKLIEGKTKKAYFMQGHGERDPDDASTPQGFKAAASALADENFEVAKLHARAGGLDSRRRDGAHHRGRDDRSSCRRKPSSSART